MKFIWLFLFFPAIITSMYINDETFGTCNFDGWILANTTAEWHDDTKNLTTNISYDEGSGNNTIYTVHITLCECNNTSTCNDNCTGKLKVWVENVDCNSTDLTQDNHVICGIVQEIKNKGNIKEFFKNRFDELDDDLLNALFCMTLENLILELF